MTIDPSVLDEYRSVIGNDADAFIAEVLTIYLENTPLVMARLRQALAQRDVKMVGRHAHSLKGGSLSVGAGEMARLAEMIEEAARGGSLNGLGENMTALEQEFDALAVTMRAMAGLPPVD
ncbi:MAG: Hpt domain-containing protein [Anaerolineae bacterium]|nr:Hpt domain-containing protein [Anaerolineae bacterium]